LLFDALGNQVGAGDDTGSVTITTVDSLVNNFGWPASFTVPRYLFRQGGAYTNENGSNATGTGGNVTLRTRVD
jgi:hypothetical protein